MSVLNQGEQTLRELLGLLTLINPHRHSNFQVLNILLKVKKKEYGLIGVVLENLLEEFSPYVNELYQTP